MRNKALFLILLLAQNTAWASAAEPFKKQYEHLQKTYYVSLKNKTETLIQQRLIFQNIDYAGLSTYYRGVIAGSNKALSVLQKGLNEDLRQYQQDPREFVLQKASLKLEGLKNLTSLTDQAHRDLKVMSSAWAGRCSNEKLERIYQHISPRALYQPDFLPHLQVQNLNFNVSYTFGNGSSGSDRSQPSPDGGQATDYDEGEALIFAGCVGLGAVAGSLIGPIGTAAGAQIGAVVGGVVITLKRFFESEAEQREIDSLIKKIRQFQLAQIDRVDAESKQWIKDACTTTSPDFDFQSEADNLALEALAAQQTVLAALRDSEQRYREEYLRAQDLLTLRMAGNLNYIQNQLQQDIEKAQAQFLASSAQAKQDLKTLFAKAEKPEFKNEQMFALDQTWTQMIEIEAHTSPVKIPGVSSYFDSFFKTLNKASCYVKWSDLCGS